MVSDFHPTCINTCNPSCVETGRNIYDVRINCDPSTDEDLCYKEIPWTKTYMNQPHIKAELGVPHERQYQSCNADVHHDFTLQGDSMRNSKPLLPELVNEGIRLLVYAGNAGMFYVVYVFTLRRP